LKYDPTTKKTTVLLKGLHFANGVQLSQNEDFVIVAESCQSRLVRYYLKGNKKGQSDLFIDGLPGLPDNIRSDGKGGILVSLIAARTSDVSKNSSFCTIAIILTKQAMIANVNVYRSFLRRWIRLDHCRGFVS